MAFAGYNGTFIYLGIAPKDHFMMFGFDAGSIIADRHHQIVAISFQSDFNPLLPMMKRVFHQITDDLAKFDLILKHFQIVCLRRNVHNNATGF